MAVSSTVRSPGKGPRAGAAAPARWGGKWQTGGQPGHQAAGPKCPQTAAASCRLAGIQSSIGTSQQGNAERAVWLAGISGSQWATFQVS